MIWIAAIALAFVFVKFGMLLILVKLLLVGMQLAGLIIVGLVATFLWQKGLPKWPFARKSIPSKEQEV